MNYLQQVQRGIDFIEDHLDEDLPLGTVARAAGMSQWHFQRIFKALSSETLKSYIRSRRLANSLDKLADTDMRIIDIAITAGFESQESFTRAFKKSFSVTPNQYRKLGQKKSLLGKKLRIDDQYLQHINRNISLQPEIVYRPPMRLIGMMTEFYSVDSDKNNIGDRLPQLWSNFLPRLGEIGNSVQGICYGVVRPTVQDPERLEYLAGIAVLGSEGRLPEGMAAVELPATEYAIFTHRGIPQHIDQTVNYIYSSWLAQSERGHSYGADLELYGSGYVAGSAESVIHYGIPLSVQGEC